MSPNTIKSPQHSATKLDHKKIFFAFSAFVTTFLLLILIIHFVPKPTKPQFYIRQLNLSGPITPQFNSSNELIFLLKNPNDKFSIYYDEFQVCTTYKNKIINNDSSFPPFYQGQQERILLSTSLIGKSLVVDPSAGLNLKVNGNLRWKIGTWVSGGYRFDVNCAVKNVPKVIYNWIPCSVSVSI